jgi:hypothetical protein
MQNRNRAAPTISRDQLLNVGMSVVSVVREIVTALSGHGLYASSPSWDLSY